MAKEIEIEDPKVEEKTENKTETSAASIALDKKRETAIRKLEEKNATLEDQFSNLTELFNSTKEENLKIREFMTSKKNEVTKKSYWTELNEYIASLHS